MHICRERAGTETILSPFVSPPSLFLQCLPISRRYFPIPPSLSRALLTSLIFIRLPPLSFRLMGELQQPLLSHPSSSLSPGRANCLLALNMCVGERWGHVGRRKGWDDEDEVPELPHCEYGPPPPTLFPSLSREKNSKAPSKKSLNSAAVPF